MPSKPRSLKCPYTGVTQEIVLDDTLGRRNGFHLNQGLDLTMPFLSREEAVAACPESVCRYTGQPIAVKEVKPGLWGYPDAYCPSKRWYSRELAEYHGSMRHGTTFRKKPATIKLQEREAPPLDPFLDRKAAPDIAPLIHETMDQINKVQA